jgi:hypothetical protein
MEEGTMKLLRAGISMGLLMAGTIAYALPSFQGHVLFEGGGYQSTQGEAQFIGINTLIGDQFNVSNRHDTNTIFGIGYLVDGYRNGRYSIDYGINAFYLAKTKVSGTITQELLFTNLAYSYYVSHLPVYLFAKGSIDTNYNNVAITIDAGLGPNFMETNLFTESSLDGITQPDNAFSGETTTTTLSGMLGIGIKFMVEKIPVEFGYRYFYLGEGSLKPSNNQILNNLNTGDTSAQALLLTFRI